LGGLLHNRTDEQTDANRIRETQRERERSRKERALSLCVTLLRSPCDTIFTLIAPCPPLSSCNPPIPPRSLSLPLRACFISKERNQNFYFSGPTFPTSRSAHTISHLSLHRRKRCRRRLLKSASISSQSGRIASATSSRAAGAWTLNKRRPVQTRRSGAPFLLMPPFFSLSPPFCTCYPFKPPWRLGWTAHLPALCDAVLCLCRRLL
jgi:hypothetical protein